MSTADQFDSNSGEQQRLRLIVSRFEAARWNAWDRSVRFVPLILKSTPQAFISRLGGQDFAISHVSLQEEDSYEVELQDTSGAPYATPSRLVFFRFTSSVWILMTVNPRYIFRHLTKMVSRLPSFVAPIFLSTRDFQSVFTDIARKDSRLRVLQLSAYNTQESSVRFLREEGRVSSVFSELLSGGQVLRNMSGAIRDTSQERVTQFRVSNNGSVALVIGAVGFVFDMVLSTIATLALEKDRLISNRERNSNGFSPISIRFDQDVLAKTSANRSLIHVLAHTERLAVGVLHANPYLHMILTDFRDGSRFTLYSSSEAQLELVPSFSASSSSITRIHRAVSEGFARCELIKGSIKPLTIQDFFPEQDSGAQENPR